VFSLPCAYFQGSLTLLDFFLQNARKLFETLAERFLAHEDTEDGRLNRPRAKFFPTF
jgi:hypothetical protein